MNGTTYPPSDQGSIGISASAVRFGHPDTDYEPILSLDEQIEAEPPPGWEAEMEQWELERAERAVEDAHATAAAEAYAYIKANVGGVLAHAERVRSEVLGGDEPAVAVKYGVYLFGGPHRITVIGHGFGDNYMEAARAAVLDLATRRAKGAA